MKLSAKKYFFLILIIAGLLILGYYRDFVFRNINSLLQARDYKAQYTSPASLLFFEQFSYNGLVNLKWLLTIVFSVLYLLITLVALRIIFNNVKYSRIAIGVYAAIMLLSGVFMIGSFLVESSSAKMYEFARYLMGMAQSPIILMILIPAFKISGQEPDNITN